MTAILRHTVTVSLDPANKQRDDGCQVSAPMMSSQCPYDVIQVADYLDPGKRMVSSE
ncbi:hypothetical protein [Wolbachia endosymbiont of Dactylopius coccus]